MSKSELVDLYVSVAKSIKKFPSFTDLKGVITPKQIEYHFGGINNLKAASAEKLKNVVIDLHFSDIKTEVTKSGRYFVTTVVAGAAFNKKALASIKTFCKKENAQLIFLPSFQKDSTGFAPEINEGVIATKNLSLGKNASILMVKNSPLKQDPVSGLDRKGKRNAISIVPSPKQRVKFVATGPSVYPHALLSPGAVTVPNYGKFIPSVSESLAQDDHVMGGLIVEIDTDDIVHFRQVQFANDGSFIDLGTLYTATGVASKKLRPTIVLGDLHAGQADPVVVKTTEDICRKLVVKNIFVHDGLDCFSISHHNIHKKITKAKMAKDNLLNLEEELKIYVSEMNRLSKLCSKVYVVKSNHDEHLERWLQEGRFMDEPQNMELGLELALAMVKGEDPVQYAARKYGCKAKNIKWLARDESVQQAGIELGAHGDKGANGSRGSVRGMERAYGKSVTGHAHTPEWFRDAHQVGNMIGTKPDYGDGPSSWLTTHELVYDNGMCQMLNIINGKFTTKKL